MHTHAHVHTQITLVRSTLSVVEGGFRLTHCLGKEEEMGGVALTKVLKYLHGAFCNDV